MTTSGWPGYDVLDEEWVLVDVPMPDEERAALTASLPAGRVLLPATLMMEPPVNEYDAAPTPALEEGAAAATQNSQPPPAITATVENTTTDAKPSPEPEPTTTDDKPSHSVLEPATTDDKPFEPEPADEPAATVAKLSRALTDVSKPGVSKPGVSKTGGLESKRRQNARIDDIRALKHAQPALTAKELHTQLGPKHGASLSAIKRCSSAVNKLNAAKVSAVAG